MAMGVQGWVMQVASAGLRLAGRRRGRRLRGVLVHDEAAPNASKSV